MSAGGEGGRKMTFFPVFPGLWHFACVFLGFFGCFFLAFLFFFLLFSLFFSSSGVGRGGRGSKNDVLSCVSGVMAFRLCFPWVFRLSFWLFFCFFLVFSFFFR